MKKKYKHLILLFLLFVNSTLQFNLSSLGQTTNSNDSPFCRDGYAQCTNANETFICPANSIQICSTNNNNSEPLCYDPTTKKISFGSCKTTISPLQAFCKDSTAECFNHTEFTCGNNEIIICSTNNNNSSPICFNTISKKISQGMCQTSSSSSGLIISSSSSSGSTPPSINNSSSSGITWLNSSGTPFCIGTTVQCQSSGSPRCTQPDYTPKCTYSSVYRPTCCKLLSTGLDCQEIFLTCPSPLSSSSSSSTSSSSSSSSGSTINYIELSFSPNEGSVNGKTLVTFQGANINEIEKVYFSGLEAEILDLRNNTLFISTPNINKPLNELPFQSTITVRLKNNRIYQIRDPFTFTTPTLLVTSIPSMCKNELYIYMSGNGGCENTTTGVTWSNSSPLPPDYRNAKDYCCRLNEGNYNDWRLAGDEIRVETDLSNQYQSRSGLNINTGEKYWINNGSTRINNYEESSRLDFYNPVLINSSTADISYSICVRNRSQVKNKYLRYNSCNTSTYQNSGLSVSCKNETTNFKSANGGCQLNNGVTFGGSATSLTYDEATNYCDNLVANGYRDWRLPSVNELNLAYTYGTINTIEELNLPTNNKPYWGLPYSNFIDFNNPDAYYFSQSHGLKNSSVNTEEKVTLNNVICVRGDISF